MKKKSLLLRLVVLLAAMMCALGASAYSFQTGGIYYNVTSQPNRTVEVTYMDASYYSLGAYDGNITIPGTVTYNGYIYTVTRIGDRAFYNADGLTSLTIPSTVLSIGELAFGWQEDHYCNRLTSITIPNSVKTIANEAFQKCYALQTVVIGDGVTSIGESAFIKCINLTNLTIGSSVTSIGADAFWGAGYDPDDSSSNASGLTITSKAVNPPTIQSSTFPSKTYSYATLKVPLGSKSAYQSANYWRNFSYIQEFYSLEQALNVSGGNITFLSAGDYPWITLQGSGRVYAQSGNAGVSSSTSEMTATVSVARTSTLSFDFKAWGEGSNYDVCRFWIDDVEQFKYGARDNDWETYSVDLSAGRHILTWSYSKDGSVNPTGDYFAVDNVAITAKTEAYACYTSSNKTLTFYYDNQRASRSGTTYDLNTGGNETGWDTDGTNANVTKVVFNSSFASARPTTTCDWFYGMTNLESITGMEYLNTSEVTNMGWMFLKCSKLTSVDVSHFNTSKVTSMYCMFNSCTGLTSLDLSSFNTSNVTNMDAMFLNCRSLTNLDLSSWNTAMVTVMSLMFHDCSQLQTIYVGDEWSTSAVTQSNNMFYGCTSLVGGMGTTYDGSHVDATYAHIDGGTSNPGYFTAKTEAYACYTPSNTTLTFYYDNQRSSRTGTTYDLNTGNIDPRWCYDGPSSNVTKVVFDPSFADARPTTTCAWFRDMTQLQTITGLYYLNTSQVTSMARMFDCCDVLTSLNVSGFNTSNVTDMSLMFYHCISLTNLDLSNFNTSNVTDMGGMFAYCSSLTSLNLSNFNTSNVTDMSYMFAYCSLTSLNLSNFNTSNVTDMSLMFYNCSSLTSLNLSSWNTAMVTNMQTMFGYCSGLTTIYVGDEWSTDAVTQSANMFYGCTSLVGGQGTTWNDSNPKDKTYAHIDGGPSNPGYLTEIPEAYACYTPSNKTLTFYYDNYRSSRTGTTYDLNTGANITGWESDGTNASVTMVVFDPSFANARPTTTYDWFYDMTNLQSITGMEYLNTSEVTDMGSMFMECSKLTSLDVSHFNTSKVIYMNQMFYGCTGLTSLDLSSFNTSQVIFMNQMFCGCTGLTSLDLSSFNTSNVTTMRYMFEGSTLLRTIYVGSGWSTAAVTNSVYMFNNCTSLVGGQGTTYNSSNPKDKTYAHIDGGPSNPGYFTDKNAALRGDVDCNGNVNISDVTALINLLLTDGALSAAADCNQDGKLSIIDVTSLINYLLSGQW